MALATESRTLPGRSSVKARVRHHLDAVRYAWLSDGVSTRPPVSIEIHPTNACNLRCAFCSYGQVRANELLDHAALAGLIDDLCACDPPIRSVVFSGGGEPSLHPVLPNAIEQLVDAGIEVGIITNGVRISTPLHEAYLRCAWVRVSLNTPRADRYQAVMSPHSERNFRRVPDNLAAFTHARDASTEPTSIVGIGYIVDRHSQDDTHLIRCLELAHEVGADYIMYRPLADHPQLQITRSLKDLAALRPRLDELSERLGITHQFHKFIREFAKTTARQPKARDHRCPIVADGLTAFVAATGDVLPCYALYMDRADTSQRYGNITEQRFGDIWTSHLRAQVVARIDARACPFCRFQGHNSVLWDLADQHADTTAPDAPPSRCDLGGQIDTSDPHWKFL